jgi:hypothetical protein
MVNIGINISQGKTSSLNDTEGIQTKNNTTSNNAFFIYALL